MSDPHAKNSQAAPDLSGYKLGNFQLLRRLGRGGMADVYLAEQISLRRQVAFKVLKQSLAADEAYVRRFHNEARAAASLVHANIVQIHEVGCIDGHHYIAQEYVAGQNLKQWLTRHRTAEANTAVHIMRQVIAALNRASQQGIIHRDIKPENIMLATTGEVKVADFGLARVVSDGNTVDLTQVGVTLGTPLYMSPEQVEGRPVDPRSDLYSFGVTCYEMLSGRPPFEGETPLNVAVQHLKYEPLRLEIARPDLPEGLCRIVHRLLAKDPIDRYQTPSELMRELRTLHVEGLGDWPAAIEEWDTPELLALSDARSEATLKLDNLMKSQAKPSHHRRVGWMIAVLIAIGAVIGAAGAWMEKPEDLLAVKSPTVERQESSMLQYWHAYDTNTEEAWLSVERNFSQDDPINRIYTWRARLRRAELYRQENQPDRARKLYEQLVEEATEVPQFVASGYIGQANLLAENSETKDRAKAKLAKAVPLYDNLPQQQQTVVLQLLAPELQDEFRELARQYEVTKKSRPDESDR